MVIHQAVGMAQPCVTINRVGREGENVLAVFIIRIDSLTGVAPTGGGTPLKQFYLPHPASQTSLIT